MGRLLLAIGFAVSMTVVAQAGVFRIPEEKSPAVSIEVPDSWNPNVSDDMIDTASPDRAIFFWLTVERQPDPAAVKAKAIKALTRNGLKIDPASAKEAQISFAGLDTTESKYAATDNGQPRLVNIRVAPLGGNRYLQLVQWGPPASFEKHAAALGKILGSVKAVGN